MNSKKDNFDISKVKLSRTRVDTILEAITILLLIAIWIIAATRVGATLSKMWDAGIIGVTVGVIGGFVNAYNPNYIRNKYITNLRQLTIASRMCRIFALELALMELCYQILALTHKPYPAWLFIPIALILVIATIYICGYFIQRAG